VTDLRRQMLEEHQRRNYSQSPARSCIFAVEDIETYFHRSPERLGPVAFSRDHRIPCCGAAPSLR
jgi:hypothetical protein